jgi:hypothetical protein
MTSATTTPARSTVSRRAEGSLMIIAVDVVALWGLCAYARRENLAA